MLFFLRTPTAKTEPAFSSHCFQVLSYLSFHFLPLWPGQGYHNEHTVSVDEDTYLRDSVSAQAAGGALPFSRPFPVHNFIKSSLQELPAGAAA